jgi:predicted nucleotidyltransferase
MDRNIIIKKLKQFKKESQQKYQIKSLGIFGSVARGEINEKSDIDIVIEISEPDLFLIVEIKEDLEKQLNQHVDIIRKRERMNPFLKKRIEKDAIYV